MFIQAQARDEREETYMLFHIERLLGHVVDDNYPLSKYLRVCKEIELYSKEMNGKTNG